MLQGKRAACVPVSVPERRPSDTVTHPAAYVDALWYNVYMYVSALMCCR